MCQIAEVLKCFCVSLAYHCSIRIIIEHINDLPRISISNALIGCRGIVVGRESTDFISISYKLLIIRRAFVFLNNRLGI